MEKWSDEAFKAAQYEIDCIKKLPFLSQLASGNMSVEKFNEYIGQDILYLDRFSRALAHNASRVPHTRDMETIIHFVTDTIAIRRTIIESYSYIPRSEPSEAIHKYSSFMESMWREEMAVECAALLPGFQIYQLIGEHIISLARLDGNPYRDWVLTYSDPAFSQNTDIYTVICNRYAAETSPEVRRRMTEVYVKAVHILGLFFAL